VVFQMIRAVIATALLLGAGSIIGGPADQSQRLDVVVGKALDAKPSSREEGRQAADDATAAALIGAIATRFSQRRIEVELGEVDVAPAGLVQRDLSGSGRLRIGTDAGWLPFRFHALYDTEQASVGSPQLTLGSDQPGSLLAARSPVVRQLGNELARRFHSEFAQPSARIALDTVRSSPAGDHYLQLQARGTARFGREGQAGADIRALYDTRSGDWLQLDYELVDRS
jgi:hypothetical protein